MKEKIKMTKEELKDICNNFPRPDISDEQIKERIDAAQTIDEIRAFFNEPWAAGAWLREIMKRSEAEAIPPEKAKRLEWVIENIEFEGTADAVQPEKEAGSQAVQSEIDEPLPVSLEMVREFFAYVPSDRIIDIHEEVDVRKGVIREEQPVVFQDNFYMQYKEGTSTRLVAIARQEKNEILAVGRIQRKENHGHILLEPENIAYNEFGNDSRFRVVMFDDKTVEMLCGGSEDLRKMAIEFRGSLYTSDCDIDYGSLEKTANPLCIDFGTSNTSVGTYGLGEEKNEIMLVSFTDVTSPEMKETELYPTLVYVDDCSDKEHVHYLFGYEAQERLLKRSYDTDASVFFEIKRWIGTMDQEEELRDEKGKTCKVKRREIVKAYIMHVIRLAQQYFKVRFSKIHMTAPVKLKEKFYQEMNLILDGSDYNLMEPDQSIDEGIAIIYNSISNLIAAESGNRMEPGIPKKIMIMDCGGGTTDLARCEVSYELGADGQGRKLHITTNFENGNSNFGGNNITFRIMQLIKIKLAARHAPDKMGEADLSELIPYSESDILDLVEKTYREEKKMRRRYNSDAESIVYREFVAAYKKAGEIIPSAFQNEEMTQAKKKVRRNYYYLWQLAERFKIKFYEEERVQLDFDRSRDLLLDIGSTENYFLYYRDGEELKKEAIGGQGVQIGITINEIRKVLCGDIYSLLNELLDPDEVGNYDYYRLAGQSCKITLFKELLKEFIPGQRLRLNKASRGKQEKDSKSIHLKLDCINGSVAYIRDRNYGSVEPIITTKPPKLIYDVYVRKVSEEQQILFKGDTSQIGYVRYPDTASQTELIVRDSYGNIERSITKEFRGIKPVSLDKIFADVKTRCVPAEYEKAVRQLEKNLNSEVKVGDEVGSKMAVIVFAIPSREGYGMVIYRIAKTRTGDKDEYGWADPVYENYEDESTTSFFDGKR